MYLTLDVFYRYRNFKTFVSPRPVQFSCVSIDSTGEFVAAGGQDVFEAYLWSMKIGKLIEVSIKYANNCWEAHSYKSINFNNILGLDGTRRTGCEHSLQSSNFQYYISVY